MLIFVKHIYLYSIGLETNTINSIVKIKFTAMEEVWVIELLNLNEEYKF